MASPILVPSVRRMPERAWTTCVSNGCVSGLARANYVPFAPQPLPPGMSMAEYAALDPDPVPGFGVPPPLDCFPRYVMWREDARTPDFAGGDPLLLWQRDPGWDFRNDCVPEPLYVVAVHAEHEEGGPGEWPMRFYLDSITNGVPPYTYSLAFVTTGGAFPPDNPNENDPTLSLNNILIQFSGTPGTSETISWVWTISDSDGHVATPGGSFLAEYPT